MSDPSPNPVPSRKSAGTNGPDEAAEVPARIGPYRILRELGAGGMAIVYLGEDESGNRYAVKLPLHVQAGDETSVKRFYREARSARGVRHPNLCPVHDVGQDGKQYFLAMAWIEGETLAHRLAAGERFLTRRALELTRTLAEALQAAHEAGIVHRDLKPSNIMLRPDGQPVIIDFGMAKRFDNSETLLTLTGSIGGTPGYMAPEQIVGSADEVGPPCDIYALGVVLYELLTGSTPFTGNVATMLGSIVSEPPAPLHALCPNIEPMLDALCLRAIEKNPPDRYDSAQEFADTISAYLSQGPEAVAGRVMARQSPAPVQQLSNATAAQPGPFARMFGSLFGRQ
jgi:serine/threonine-protein kinase